MRPNVSIDVPSDIRVYGNYNETAGFRSDPIFRLKDIAAWWDIFLDPER